MVELTFKIKYNIRVHTVIINFLIFLFVRYVNNYTSVITQITDQITVFTAVTDEN